MLKHLDRCVIEQSERVKYYSRLLATVGFVEQHTILQFTSTQITLCI